MRLSLVAIGRLKAGPERELVERYTGRIEQIARSLGMSGLDVIEIPESRARREGDRRREEAASIVERTGPALLVLLDERGKSPTSEDFARRLGGWRDGGRSAAAFVIGGPDGLDQDLRARAELVFSFGALTLPHQLVRVLLAEQVYRALTILAGHPYHRAGQTEL